jgi:drug/metabolite transporter (DMT)-like permease
MSGCKSRSASRQGVAFSLSATALWAAGSLLTKHSLKHFPPLTLLVIELVASVVTLSGLLAVTRSGQRAPRSMFRLAAPGFLQPGLAYMMSFIGLKWLDSISVETLIWSAEGVAMIPFSIMFLREKVPSRMFLLGLIALFGIGLVTIPSGLAPAVSLAHVWGSALIIGAVLSACWYTVLAQRDLHDHDPLLLTTLHNSAALTFAFIFALVAAPSAEASIFTPGTVAEACLAGVCLFALPFWLYLHSIQLIGSSSAAQFLPIVPVLTIFLARLLLHETLTLRQIVGSTVTLCAILGMVWSAAGAER